MPQGSAASGFGAQKGRSCSFCPKPAQRGLHQPCFYSWLPLSKDLSLLYVPWDFQGKWVERQAVLRIILLTWPSLPCMRGVVHPCVIWATKLLLKKPTHLAELDIFTPACVWAPIPPTLCRVGPCCAQAAAEAPWEPWTTGPQGFFFP